MKWYSVAAVADTLGITPRTLRRWIAAGDVPGAEQVQGRRGPAWRVPAAAIDQLRNRCARDAEPLPVVERAPEVRPVELDDAPVSQPAEQQLAIADSSALLGLIEAVQASATVAAERERQASERVSAAWQRTIDDQGDTIAHLRAQLEQAADALQAEREAHALTRGELAQAREWLGLRTRPTVPLRVVEGGGHE